MPAPLLRSCSTSPPLPPASRDVLILLLAAVLTLFLARPAQAQQTFAVTTTSDSGPGSLRQAVAQANSTPGLPADTIVFDLPASAPGYDAGTETWAIQLQGELPDVVEPVYLNGTTQPGYANRPLIDLNGYGLTFTSVTSEGASDSFVSGLILRGVFLEFANRVEIRGNYVGTDALGENGREGTGIEFSGAFDAVIAQNVISGNDTGIRLAGPNGASARIEGNLIGTNATGDTAVPNGDGIFIAGSSSEAVIGGASEEARNVISGNSGYAISLSTQADESVITGNYIGTNAAGDAALPNGGGILITDDSSFNQIGGTAPGEGNVIAYNQGAGVRLFGCCFVFFGNSIRGNSLFQNAGLGIDLGDEGLTPNDPSDADGANGIDQTGPNGLQNFPEITSADYNPETGEVTVAYRVDTDPSYAGYPIAVDVYLSDGSEGRAYLGTNSYAEADFTSGSDKVFTFAPAASIAAEDSLVATATDLSGNTSEFSPAIAVSAMLADATPPVCGPIEIERTEGGDLAAISTTASDAESGIASVAFTTLQNLEGFLQGVGGFAEGDTETFAPNATEMVAIRGERIDFTQGGTILTTVTNGVGGTATCDPVVEQIAAKVPQAFALEGNAPNPFRETTRIGFSLAEPAEVTLEVFDLLGRKVTTLVRGEQLSASTYSVAWDGRDEAGRAVESGVYFYRIKAGSFEAARRMTVVR